VKICIAAPIASIDVAVHLDAVPATMPSGYTGAPLTGVLIGELLRAGHEVAAVTVDYRMPRGAPAVCLRGPRFEFHVLPGRRRAWRCNGLQPGRALDLFRIERARIAQAIRACRPDIVHAHWTYEFALGAIDSGVPHVITAHDAPRQVLRYTRSPYRLLRWLMAREVIRKARCLTTVSSYMAEQLRQMGAGSVAVMANPVAPEVFDAGHPRARAPSLAIGMVCNGWSRQKNPEAALQAFSLLLRSQPAAQMHLFGADFGPGEAVQRWATRAGLGEGLHFHGPMAHPDLMTQLAQLDLLVHPALEESFGVVLAEAMALGLPVVAGRASGAVPWVVGDGGMLVDVHDPQAICAAMATLLTDERAYSGCSVAARERATSTFSARDIAARYMLTYRRCIDTAESAMPLPIPASLS
jgi:glycosyltransferase involved in cell wall biosynthesis